ncbi:MAG: GGDEF domain-containing protein [Lacrimispora sp.]|uniref:GGDEF domain-containing protein n=1 Tax=Lacrimispora sp. TaxID=2719234 RepID=UPI0039E58964
MSLNFNVETLIFTIVLGHLFSGILGIAYMTQHKKDSSLYIFLFARLFDTCAWTLLGMRGMINTFVSISIGNSFLVVAQVLQSTAFLSIKERYSKVIKRRYFIIAAISIILLHLALLLHDIAGIRVSIMSISGVMLWFYPIYILLTDKNSSVLQKTVAFIYTAELLLLVVRGYMGFKLGESMQLMTNNIYNVSFYIFLYLIMLIGNIGFILIAKEKSDMELVKVATYDELTDIFTRREFLSQGKKSIALYARKREPISLFLIDLDNFKRINDVYGHSAGDHILKEFAMLIKGQLRQYDLFGRFGGEEFTVLLPGTGEGAAFETAERLRKAVENASIDVGAGQIVKFTISIGMVTVTPDENTSIYTLYKLSDDALYAAKRNGRNRVEVVKSKDSGV